VKIAICDDNESELEKISDAVQEFVKVSKADKDITVKDFLKGSDLLNYLNWIDDFDLLILDVIMPGLSGVELAKEIRATNKNCKIIFLTSSPEFAVVSYKLDAFYYLLKPFVKHELISLLEKALVLIKDETTKSILIKEKSALRCINLNALEYVESIKHTLNFHLSGGEVAVCYAKMDEFENNILSDIRFIRCHQSFIVNMNGILKITDKYIILVDKTEIPISRTLYPAVKQFYINYIFRRGNVL